MVRTGNLDRSTALELLSQRENTEIPEGFFDFMKSINCSESILEDTQGKSASDFKGRNQFVRSLAGKLRAKLP